MSTRQESTDDILIEQLANGATHVAAGNAAGISDRTVRRRLEDPEFRGHVRARRAVLLDESSGRIVASSRAAADTLDELREGAESESVRLHSALATLRHSRTIVDLDDLDERVGRVEAKLHALEEAIQDDDDEH